jgi:hypothetical protein
MRLKPYHDSRNVYCIVYAAQGKALLRSRNAAFKPAVAKLDPAWEPHGLVIDTANLYIRQIPGCSIAQAPNVVILQVIPGGLQ